MILERMIITRSKDATIQNKATSIEYLKNSLNFIVSKEIKFNIEFN